MVERWFAAVVARPLLAGGAGLLLCMVLASGLPTLEKDIRADAYLSENNAALRYRDQVRETFGLSDPFVIAVATASGDIYRPEVLALVASLTDAVGMLPGFDVERVYSLASERGIDGAGDEIAIDYFFSAPLAPADAALTRARVAAFPPVQGRLVSADGRVALVVAEPVDESQGEAGYLALQQLLAQQTLPAGVTLHVAGEGAVSAYLGRYMDSDAMRLNPIAAAVILSVILLAFGRVAVVLATAVIVLATLASTLGAMALAAVPAYIITNALPVILIGMAVADTIHVVAHYFDLLAREPERERRAALAASMAALWRPITLTTVTTVCGFLGLYAAAYMPPFRYFGLFAALGVALAWVYTLVLLPALLALWQPAPRPGRRDTATLGPLVRSGMAVYRRAPVCIAALVALLMAALLALSQLQVDEDRIAIFRADEPIRIADTLMNQHQLGTGRLDIVVSSDEPNGLLRVDRLAAIAALQAQLAAMPGVTATTSVVDYLRQLNLAFNNGAEGMDRLPETDAQVAQYLLMYSAMSDPTELEEEIDYDYATALVQVSLSSGAFSDIQRLLTEVDAAVAAVDPALGLQVALSGRAVLTYHWVKDLAHSHLLGMLVALGLVLLVSTLLFRSLLAGLVTLVPVLVGLAAVYLAMVLGNIPLGVGSSMFAAVSVGLGIDFAIHTVARCRELDGREPAVALAHYYRVTGRALLVNFASLASGFGVLVLSNISSLVEFGAIVVLSLGASFLVSVVLLPGLWFRYLSARAPVEGDKG